jgi:predicted unusual protein kinase regulating ubiquinone biosynthesis (AarF/ABC1/UbiB family)
LEAKIKIKEEGIVIPKKLFKEMVGTYIKMEQILATLETLVDKETLKAIEESKKQVAKGEYVECSISDLEKVLK